VAGAALLGTNLSVVGGIAILLSALTSLALVLLRYAPLIASVRGLRSRDPAERLDAQKVVAMYLLRKRHGVSPELVSFLTHQCPSGPAKLEGSPHVSLIRATPDAEKAPAVTEMREALPNATPPTPPSTRPRRKRRSGPVDG
jgi:hypothetical protein